MNLKILNCCLRGLRTSSTNRSIGSFTVDVIGGVANRIHHMNTGVKFSSHCSPNSSNTNQSMNRIQSYTLNPTHLDLYIQFDTF